MCSVSAASCSKSSLCDKMLLNLNLFTKCKNMGLNFPLCAGFKAMDISPPALTIRKLVDLCKSDAGDLDSMTKSYTRQANTLQFPDLLNDHLYWSYKLLRSDDISPDLVQCCFHCS